jgi:hypothetical protein
MSGKLKMLTPSNVLAMQRALSYEPHTIAQLASVGGINPPTVRRFVNGIREKSRDRAGRMDIYIAAWVADARGRLFTPAYAWGPRADTPRPGQRFTSAQRMARGRARVKAAA